MRVFRNQFAAAFALGTVVSGCATRTIPASTAAPLQTVTLPPAYTLHSIAVTVEGLYRNERGVVIGFTGTAQNVGNAAVTACIIHLEILNDAGEKIADAVATTAGLRAGQTWHFHASLKTPYSEQFKAVQPGRIVAIRLHG